MSVVGRFLSYRKSLYNIWLKGGTDPNATFPGFLRMNENTVINHSISGLWLMTIFIDLPCKVLSTQIEE